MSKSQKTETVEAKMFVSRQFTKLGKPSKPEENESNQLEVMTFQVEPAYVRASFGLTINMGNYESVKCDVSVTLPCYVEEIPEALSVAQKLAEDEVSRQQRIVKGKEDPDKDGYEEKLIASRRRTLGR
jgi:hypothetical protein